MKNIVIAAVSALLFSCPVFAQQTLLGKYSGTISRFDQRGEAVTGFSLEIVSVVGDTVSAKAVRASRGRSPCAGEYQLEGKVKGDSLELSATKKSGAAGDCDMTLKLTVEGNKLAGTMNDSKAQLSK